MSSQLVAAYIRSSFCLCCLTCSRIVNIDVNVSFDVCFFESIRGSHENSVAGKSCRRIAHCAYQQIERGEAEMMRDGATLPAKRIPKQSVSVDITRPENEGARRASVLWQAFLELGFARRVLPDIRIRSD